MRWHLLVLAFCLLLAPAWGQLQSPEAVEADIRYTLRPFEFMGRQPFKTAWPAGQAKESYLIGKGGKVSYVKFFPAGNTAINYQRLPNGAVVYEKKYGDGKDAIIIKQDERIVDYTSYWPNGQKKGKYQKNLQTKTRYYTAYNADGKQIYPNPK